MSCVPSVKIYPGNNVWYAISKVLIEIVFVLESFAKFHCTQNMNDEKFYTEIWKRYTTTAFQNDIFPLCPLYGITSAFQTYSQLFVITICVISEILLQTFLHLLLMKWLIFLLFLRAASLSTQWLNFMVNLFLNRVVVRSLVTTFL